MFLFSKLQSNFKPLSGVDIQTVVLHSHVESHHEVMMWYS